MHRETLPSRFGGDPDERKVVLYSFFHDPFIIHGDGLKTLPAEPRLQIIRKSLHSFPREREQKRHLFGRHEGIIVPSKLE